MELIIWTLLPVHPRDGLLLSPSLGAACLVVGFLFSACYSVTATTTTTIKLLGLQEFSCCGSHRSSGSRGHDEPHTAGRTTDRPTKRYQDDVVDCYLISHTSKAQQFLLGTTARNQQVAVTKLAVGVRAKLRVSSSSSISETTTTADTPAVDNVPSPVFS